MTHRSDEDPRVLSDTLAERTLARAAELDTARPMEISIAQLRAIAAEAGISAAALDSALAEIPAAPEVIDRGTGDSSTRAAPKWIRLCLFGVPDRPVAMAFYWAFLLMTLVPLLALVLAPEHVALFRTELLASSAWGVFALWSTSRAIRWADQHGWDSIS